MSEEKRVGLMVALSQLGCLAAAVMRPRKF
ncbi:potassium-transporting ATPase subunit F [Streptomyces marianii]|uniref:Potassium-transporting ATPase subunit F n=1 Tax=Streptomyces marianii TaxID=1817406 RepID=A0A5R9E908_9ACTN|nr:potassium-transporting ATPase subunit F [Streptomyces marianii]TLQ44704.1 potassium-transporting ATPase subunit F [Streptomyces marianii]